MFIDFFLKSKISEELFGTLMLISFLSSCFFCFSIPLLVTIFSKKDDNFIKKSAFGHKLGKNKIFIFDYTSYNELIDYVENSKNWKNVHKKIKFNKYYVDIFTKAKSNSYTRALIFQVYIKLPKIEKTDFESIKAEFEKILIDNYGEERKEILTWFIFCIDKETPYFNEVITSYL